MKKIIVCIAVVGLAHLSTNAQTVAINACGKKQDKVCMASKDGKTNSCYKTQFAESYKVCKNINGYYICCETPNNTNSTFSWVRVVTQEHPEGIEYYNTSFSGNGKTADATTPQNQSYINIQDTQ